jgi:hypothetical protein
MSKVKMQFDTKIAKLVGTDAAIIYSNIDFWIETNKANKVNFFDGKYWMYHSIKAFCELFDYLSESQIKTCLNKLEKANLIITGNYNQIGYDRTKWYSLPENITISEKSLMDLSNNNNRLVENSQPIQDNKTDKIDFNTLMAFFNKTFDRNCRVFPQRAKKQFYDRLKEGYTKKDIQNTIINIKNSKWHIENNYGAVTLEFISRARSFELYSQLKVKEVGGHTNH